MTMTEAMTVFFLSDYGTGTSSSGVVHAVLAAAPRD
jgi:hypothetical protein